MQYGSSCSSFLPRNSFLTLTSGLSLTSLFEGLESQEWLVGRRDRGERLFFGFDVTLGYTWVTGHALL